MRNLEQKSRHTTPHHTVTFLTHRSAASLPLVQNIYILITG